MSNQQTLTLGDEADELDETFFATAVLTCPGESVVEVVSRAHGLLAQDYCHCTRKLDNDQGVCLGCGGLICARDNP